MLCGQGRGLQNRWWVSFDAYGGSTPLTSANLLCGNPRRTYRLLEMVKPLEMQVFSGVTMVARWRIPLAAPGVNLNTSII